MKISGFRIATIGNSKESGCRGPFRRAPSATIRLNSGARSSLVLSEGVLYTQTPLLAENENKIFGPAKYRNVEGIIATFRNKSLIHVGRNLQTINKGTVIAGQTYNWWHWLIEVLPKAFLATKSAEEWADWPLILRSVGGVNPNVQQTVDIVLKDNTVKWAPPDSFFRVQDAIFWDGTVTLSREQLAPYRELLRQEALAFPCVHAGERIFLKRAEGLSRRYNQSELSSIAERFGFQIIDPAETSLPELWTQLSRARIVVGAQGAGWANTIVCPEGSVGLQWAGGRLRGKRFHDLADLCKMDLRTMVAQGDFGGDYVVDSAEFTKRLERALRDAGQ